jgi:hypothetical protein
MAFPPTNDATNLRYRPKSDDQRLRDEKVLADGAARPRFSATDQPKSATLRLIPVRRAAAHGLTMALVRTDTLPRASSLWSYHRPGDFLDCYSVASTLSPREAAVRGFVNEGWVKWLLLLRNALVRPFGLKTGAAPDTPSVAIFPVHKEDDQELILGLDDHHLDFRIAVIRQEGRIYMSTWVHPHSFWGRAYLAVVMPFHILISRRAVARMAAMGAESKLPES